MQNAANQQLDIRADVLAPHSVEAENAVIGAIMIDAAALFEVMGFLKPADFFIIRNGWIYEAILSLHTRRDPIDFLTITNEIEQRGQLDEIGGRGYLHTILAETPSSLNVEGYGHIVERMAMRRRLIDAASQIARVAHSDETEIDAVVSKAEQALFGATQRRTERGIKTMRTLVADHYDTMQRVAREGIKGIKTYQRDVDRVLRAMRSGDLVLVAGRPGMGKTAWILTVALENARRGIPIGLLSLEMGEEQLTNRVMAAETGIAYKTLESAELESDEWSIYTDKTTPISEWPICIDDTAQVSAMDAYGKIRRMVWEYGVEAVFIDYIQLMSGAGENDKNRAQELSFISRQLKLAAREFRIPVICAAQLNREVESRPGKRPQLSDLKDSGSLEQDSDVVIFLYRDAYYNPDTAKGNTTEVHIAKHRNGATGTVETAFLPERMKFADIYNPLKP